MTYPTGQLLCAGLPHLHSPTDVPPPLMPLFAPVQTIPGAFPSFPTDPGQCVLYLEAKVVVGEVSVVDDGRVEALAGNNKTDLYKV